MVCSLCLQSKVDSRGHKVFLSNAFRLLLYTNDYTTVFTHDYNIVFTVVNTFVRTGVMAAVWAFVRA